MWEPIKPETTATFLALVDEILTHPQWTNNPRLNNAHALWDLDYKAYPEISAAVLRLFQVSPVGLHYGHTFDPALVAERREWAETVGHGAWVACASPLPPKSPQRTPAEARECGKLLRDKLTDAVVQWGAAPQAVILDVETDPLYPQSYYATIANYIWETVPGVDLDWYGSGTDKGRVSGAGYRLNPRWDYPTPPPGGRRSQSLYGPGDFGTASQLVRLTGDESEDITAWVSLGSYYQFTADRGSNGYETWKHDGRAPMAYSWLLGNLLNDTAIRGTERYAAWGWNVPDRVVIWPGVPLWQSPKRHSKHQLWHIVAYCRGAKAIETDPTCADLEALTQGDPWPTH